MRTVAFALLVSAAVTVPAQAQSSDAAYCSALAGKYKQYVGEGSDKRGAQASNARIETAISQCTTNSASAIPVLEQALKDAKIDLPPRS